MPICDYCSTAVRKLRPHDWPPASLEHEQKLYVTLPRCETLWDIECWICHRFFQWLELEDPEVLEIWRKEPLEVEFQPHSRIQMEKPNLGPALAPFFLEILPPGYSEEDLGCEIELNFITGEDIPATQAIAPKFGGMEGFNFDLIRTWFNQCTKQHERCKTSDRKWFPTRLIHLGSQDSEVKLIISNDTPPSGPYMSLSHRWGPQNYTKLESSTMKQLQKAINIDTLPRVFQDAIKIARLLGLEYIWIDALCIKQDPDDKSDWKLESRKMGKVYSHAILNISATLSKNGSESLFDQQPQKHILPSEIELEYKGLPQMYYVFDGNIWKDEIDDAPLNQRGWVYQERFLAPRVLHFGRHQIGWECLELEALEMFPGGFLGLNAVSKRIKLSRREIEEGPAPRPGRHPFEKFVDYWHELVHAYSKAELTYSNDKLFAFAGIVERTKQRRADEYAAGMWESTLLFHLPWARYASDREANPISETSSRAPSWSWASVDGEITFPSLMGGLRVLLAFDLEFVGQLDIAGSAPAGTTSIQVRCLRLPIDVELMDEEEDINSFDVEGFHFTANDETMMDIEVPFQQLRRLVQCKKLFLVPLFASVYFFNAILLAPILGTDSYARLGAVQIPLKATDNPSILHDGLSTTMNPSDTKSASSQGSSEESEWDINATKFLRHCFDQIKSASQICIS